MEERRIPGPHWSVSLAELVSSTFNERLCLKQQGWISREIPNNDLWPPHAHTASNAWFPSCFYFTWSHLSTTDLTPYTNGVTFRKAFSTSISCGLLSMFSSSCLSVLGLPFRSLVYLELVFVQVIHMNLI